MTYSKNELNKQKFKNVVNIYYEFSNIVINLIDVNFNILSSGMCIYDIRVYM